MSAMFKESYLLDGKDPSDLASLLCKEAITMKSTDLPQHKLTKETGVFQETNVVNIDLATATAGTTHWWGSKVAAKATTWGTVISAAASRWRGCKARFGLTILVHSISLNASPIQGAGAGCE
jgi:hypothetical protein